MTANVAPTLYSCSLSLQVCLPFEWVLRIPRYALSTVVTAILIPLAIVGSTHFYDALVNFLGIIGYWSACFGGVVFIEHLLFRRGQFRNYNIPHWDQPRLLPPGAAALLSCVGAIAVIVPFMDQVWWVGPAATRTGDIGFEVGFVVAALFYAFARTVEKKLLR